ncbi:diphosphoinositol-polyphosphate diphosphatase [Pancytospora philotis]|nr:diphosphoinositol-polyphosphate diphosphatase [Pancytospora philotis]
MIGWVFCSPRLTGCGVRVPSIGMKGRNRELAGIIPVGSDGRILLISNAKRHFIFPKGGVKKHESPLEAAVREAAEEAGISGSTPCEPAVVIRNTTYYIMHVSHCAAEFEEAGRRERLWMRPEAADESSNAIPKYVKEIIKVCIRKGLLS